MKNAVCSICGSSKEVRNYQGKKILCHSHRRLLARHGYIPSRTTRQPNEIVVECDIAKIKLYDKFGKTKAETIIDKSDVDRVSKHKWHFHHSGYSATAIKDNFGKYKSVRLHQFIFGRTSQTIDHINNNKLDNRRCNLREASKQQNCFNRKHVSGVFFSKDNRWISQLGITTNNKKQTVYLGSFKTKEEALAARIAGEKQFYGEFAPYKHRIQKVVVRYAEK